MNMKLRKQMEAGDTNMEATSVDIAMETCCSISCLQTGFLFILCIDASQVHGTVLTYSRHSIHIC